MIVVAKIGPPAARPWVNSKAASILARISCISLRCECTSRCIMVFSSMATTRRRKLSRRLDRHRFWMQ